MSSSISLGMAICDCRRLCDPDPECDIERDAQTGYKGSDPNAEAALELD